MNEEAIVKTNLKDYLFHTSTLCACDESQFTKAFTDAEKKSIAKARAQEASSGKRVWYPLTQQILGRLVYGVNYIDLLCHIIHILNSFVIFLIFFMSMCFFMSFSLMCRKSGRRIMSLHAVR